MTSNDFVTFDIETRAADEAVAEAIAAKKDELDAIAAPANWKDPAKIEKYVADKRAAIIESLRKVRLNP